MRNSCADVVLLQETYSTPDIEFLWSNKWRKNSILNSGTNNVREVAILILNEYLYSNFQCNKDGGTIALDINVHGKYFHLVNIYAPVGGVNSTHADQEVYYSTIHQFVYSRYPPLLVVISCVVTTLPMIAQVTLHDVHKLNSYKSQNLINLRQTFDLHDLLRITNGNSSHFTRHGSTVASRLDRFYVSTAVNVNLCGVQVVAVSDQSFSHKLVIIQQNQSFGQGFWKNNVSLYEDPSCYEYIASQWNKWVNLRPIYSNVVIWWLETKQRLRELLISLSKSKRVLENNEMAELEQKLQQLFVALSCGRKVLTEFKM